MSIDRAEIIEAIRRCARTNGGRAVGKERFAELTGITEAQWLGRYWVRWSDAVADAGFPANAMNEAIPDEDVLAALADLVLCLDRYPTTAELKMRKQSDPSFPHHMVFRRFGLKADVAARLAEFAADDPERQRVVELCAPIAQHAARDDDGHRAPAVAGFVYLVKSGSYYKIGRSNSAGRRAYELAIQLPERLDVIHVIETDDPVGIERYWHQRFGDRRANGEWFALTTADVAAFRRRKKYM